MKKTILILMVLWCFIGHLLGFLEITQLQYYFQTHFCNPIAYNAFWLIYFGIIGILILITDFK